MKHVGVMFDPDKAPGGKMRSHLEVISKTVALLSSNVASIGANKTPPTFHPPNQKKKPEH